MIVDLVVFLGNLTPVEARPEAHAFVHRRALVAAADRHRQLLAPCTTTSRRTVPPDAGRVDGIAASRPIRGFGSRARLIFAGPTSGAARANDRPPITAPSLARTAGAPTEAASAL